MFFKITVFLCFKINKLTGPVVRQWKQLIIEYKNALVWCHGMFCVAPHEIAKKSDYQTPKVSYRTCCDHSQGVMKEMEIIHVFLLLSKSIQWLAVVWVQQSLSNDPFNTANNCKPQVVTLKQLSAYWIGNESPMWGLR